MSSQICISEHAYRLNILLCDEQIRHYKTSDWLNLGAGIVSLEYNYARFDSLVGWCRPADEYNDAHSRLYKDYLLALTRFNYIWSGFESFCNDTLSKSQIRRKGKVNAFKDKLTDSFISYDTLPYFRNTVDDLVLELEKGDLKKYFTSIKIEKSIIEFPITLVYKIRNEFAHGDAEFPIPEAYGSQIIDYSKVIDLSSRVVLYYIQLYLIKFYGSYDTYPYPFFQGLDDLDIEFIKVKHVVKYIDQDYIYMDLNQMQFEF